MRHYKRIEVIWPYLPPSKRLAIFMVVLVSRYKIHIHYVSVICLVGWVIYFVFGENLPGLIAGLLAGCYAALLIPVGGARLTSRRD